MSRPIEPKSDPHPDPSALDVGYIAGAYGTRGAVRLVVHDADTEAIEAGRTIILCRQDQPTLRREITKVSLVPGKATQRRVSLDGIRDRDEAAALRGFAVMIDREQLPALADDEYYLADAIGRPVERLLDGTPQSLGQIYGVTTNGAQDLFEVRWRGPDGRNHDWLLPVLPHTIVEMGEQRVLVDLPLGMVPEPLDEPAAPGGPESEP